MSNSNIIRMANDIATFHTSFPEDEAAKLIAEHLNKFWPPPLRSQFFDLLDTESDKFHPLVVACATQVRCEKRNPICTAHIDRTGTGG